MQGISYGDPRATILLSKNNNSHMGLMQGAVLLYEGKKATKTTIRRPASADKIRVAQFPGSKPRRNPVEPQNP